MKKAKYRRDMPRLLYTYYTEAIGGGEIPSISKFARRMAITVGDVEKFREHSEFEKAYKEVNEIRRDYLIDSALMKRFDSSFTKFILTEEFGNTGECEDMTVCIKVED
jgi:hypothetical protein